MLWESAAPPCVCAVAACVLYLITVSRSCAISSTCWSRLIAASVVRTLVVNSVSKRTWYVVCHVAACHLVCLSHGFRLIPIKSLIINISKKWAGRSSTPLERYRAHILFSSAFRQEATDDDLQLEHQVSHEFIYFRLYRDHNPTHFAATETSPHRCQPPGNARRSRVDSKELGAYWTAPWKQNLILSLSIVLHVRSWLYLAS